MNPNGYIRFETDLGTVTDINCHVKISGVMCIWTGQYIDDPDGNQKLYIPSFKDIKKYPWFGELVRKYGECQGLFQNTNKVIVPGEEEPKNNLSW